MVLLLCIGLGLAGLVSLFYISYRATEPAHLSADPKEAFTHLREQVDSLIKRNDVLNASVERNPNSFSCLYTVNAACQGKGGPFQIFESAGPQSQPFSQLMKDAGLRADLTGCNGFPSRDCPLRVEASWEPVCAPGGHCEQTRSARLSVKVILDDKNGTNDAWQRETVFSPSIKLSQAVTCERGGGVWALTECLTPAQASQRALASGRLEPPTQVEGAKLDYAHKEFNPAPTPEIYCPNDLVIQGEVYFLEHIGPNRAQARVPAMNGCPAEDVFTFQCQGNSPDAREGQWIQVSAEMAPGCLPPADVSGGYSESQGASAEY